MLLTVSGLQKDTWHLLCFGLLGMIQNVRAAGASRVPECFNMPLKFCAEFAKLKVMETLQLKIARLGNRSPCGVVWEFDYC